MKFLAALSSVMDVLFHNLMANFKLILKLPVSFKANVRDTVQLVFFICQGKTRVKLTVPLETKRG